MAKSFPNTGATTGLSSDRTAISSPVSGMQFFETDTSTLYIYSGSAWVALASAAAPPGLQLINSTTIGSAVNTVTLSGVFSATYNAYKVIISNTTCANSNHLMGIRLGASTTRTDYKYGGVNINLTSGAVATDFSLAATLAFISYTATDTMGCAVDIINPYLTKSTHFYSVWGPSGTSGAYYSGSMSAVDSLASSFTDFSVYSTDAMTGGTINVYGYRNTI
jgi:hypothetical protein